jgi:hypothetical protein
MNKDILIVGATFFAVIMAMGTVAWVAFTLIE